MKKAKILFAILTLGLSFYFALTIANSVFKGKSLTKNENDISQFAIIQDGDMIFQTSESAQCEAVRIATQSKFSHCGIVFIEKNKKMVLEAVQPLKITPLEDWIKHGRNNDFVVKRLKNSTSILSKTVLEKMKTIGKSMLKKDYDLYFGWGDDKIYCSELIWKIYKNGANIEVCPLQRLKDFDLENPIVKTILEERYGNAIPLEEKVVAPSDLEKSMNLETVIDTY
jgi:uncharacterized protein YycO